MDRNDVGYESSGVDKHERPDHTTLLNATVISIAYEGTFLPEEREGICEIRKKTGKNIRISDLFTPGDGTFVQNYMQIRPERPIQEEQLQEALRAATSPINCPRIRCEYNV